jgi:hypothetical protein
VDPPQHQDPLLGLHLATSHGGELPSAGSDPARLQRAA